MTTSDMSRRLCCRMEKKQEKCNRGVLRVNMALSKSDFGKLDSRLKNIIDQPVEQIEINSDLPPTIEQLEDNNKTYSIVAAILFIDIRKSTYLTENSQAKSMVKIYRSFMRMAVDCVRKNGGVTRQFLGDRIMGVFIDSVDESGLIVEKAVDKAINAARSLLTVIDYSLNKYLKSKVNGKTIECGIGIDYGKVLVTQVGMYGVEQDENKENEVDCVWVGNTTNHASKYSDLASGGEIFISDNVYKQLAVETLREKTIRSLLEADMIYQKDSENEGIAEMEYLQLDLTEEQRKVCNRLLECRDKEDCEYATHSYIAGLYDAFRIMTVVFPDKWDTDNIRELFAAKVKN